MSEESPVWCDTVHCADARGAWGIPDDSIDLVVTSPPYNVSIEYTDHDDHLSQDAYLGLLDDVFARLDSLVKPDGRVALNLPAGNGHDPFVPIHEDAKRLLRNHGFEQRTEIVWAKGLSGGSGDTGWGSWQSASNPVVRYRHEYIYVFDHGSRRKDSGSKQDTLTADRFKEVTKSVWEFDAVQPSDSPHPAPFPLELPARLIDLYAYADDTVYDPFCGSGTTCVAAKQRGRHWVGVDNSPDYVKLARDRLDAADAEVAR